MYKFDINIEICITYGLKIVIKLYYIMSTDTIGINKPEKYHKRYIELLNILNKIIEDGIDELGWDDHKSFCRLVYRLKELYTKEMKKNEDSSQDSEENENSSEDSEENENSSEDSEDSEKNEDSEDSIKSE